MSLSTEEIEQIENSESALVQRLYAEYKVFSESPYVESYLSALHQLKKWDEEMLSSPVGINDNEQEKAFDRVLKYLDLRDKLLQSLDATRMRMTGVQKEKLKKSKTIETDESVTL